MSGWTVRAGVKCPMAPRLPRRTLRQPEAQNDRSSGSPTRAVEQRVASVTQFISSRLTLADNDDEHSDEEDDRGGIMAAQSQLAAEVLVSEQPGSSSDEAEPPPHVVLDEHKRPYNSPLVSGKRPREQETDFPRRVARSKLAATTSPSLAAPRLTNILIVDDNTLELKLQKRLCEKLGFSVNTARNGTEALSMLKERRYQLVVCDGHMPASGDEMLRQFRQWEAVNRGNCMPFIGMSSDESYHDQFISSGAQGFLNKPVDMEKIRTVYTQYVTC